MIASHRKSEGYRAAVIGGGWAGCAAALELARAGIAVTLYEQGNVLGGRARRVHVNGRTLDNGQHLLIGAYRECLRAIERATNGAAAAVLARSPLRLDPFGRTRDAVGLSAWRLPAPLHLVAALAFARGLSWSERMALIGGFRTLQRRGFVCEPDVSVREAFAATPQRAFDALWAPLCLAALNTAPERASAQVFARVLAAAFTGEAQGSDFLLPRGDLSSLFPEPAADRVRAAGGRVVMGARVLGLDVERDHVTVATREGPDRFDAAIVAVGPHQLRAIALGGMAAAAGAGLVQQVAAFGYEPITTVYAAYAGVDCPAIGRLDDAPGQWIFDRGLGADAERVVGVVISAGGAHDAWPQAELVRVVDAQLRRLRPGWPALRWARVIAERRATYACVPGMTRPRAGRLVARLHLAGDYCDPEFPATLEAAVRTGHVAAQSLLVERDALVDRFLERARVPGNA